MSKTALKSNNTGMKHMPASLVIKMSFVTLRGVSVAVMLTETRLKGFKNVVFFHRSILGEFWR